MGSSKTPGRTLVWFSCGAASAVAAKLTLEQRGPDEIVEVLYCDTLAYEHPDNLRFLRAVEAWIGTEIKILKSEKYTDIYDVFRKTGWLVGVGGARCTTELKKNVRKRYQRPGDTHVFGLTVEEGARIERFEDENVGVETRFPLHAQGIGKAECLRRLSQAGIEIPAMYRLGYQNNNCIGCVKGQQGYWNKIRKDFPETFQRMARLEREMNVAINKRYEGKKRIRVFLDELDPNAGRGLKEPDIECGVLCVNESNETVSRWDTALEDKTE